MRDQHRDKRELIEEITGLRKQVADLKQTALERKRVEDGLRRSEEAVRAITDSVPVGLCLLTAAGEAVVANQCLAGLLGYSSGEELVRISRELGLIPAEGDRSRLCVADQPGTPMLELNFRRKDGRLQTLVLLGASPAGADRMAAVLVDPALVGRIRDPLSVGRDSGDSDLA